MNTLIQFAEHAVDLRHAYLRGLPSDATRKAYGRCLSQFDAFLGDRQLLEVTRRDVEAWRAALEAAGRAPSTICRALSALSGLYDFAVDEGAIEVNPATRARRPRLPKTSSRRALSGAEARALFSAVDTTTLIGRRDVALLALLVVQGLRVSEAVGVRVEDLDQEQGHHVATIRGKGGTRVRVPLAAATVTALDAWLAAAVVESGPVLIGVGRDGVVDRSGSPLHRSSAWERVRLLGKRAGIKGGVFPHQLRHTSVTEALLAGVPLHRVQDHARHADPRTTRRYDSHRQSLSNPTPHILADRLIS